MLSHTEGKLFATGNYVRTLNGALVFISSIAVRKQEEAEADARRLVACWNMCDGKSTDQIEKMIEVGNNLEKVMDYAYQTVLERDEALGVLRGLLSSPDGGTYRMRPENETVKKAKAVLAKHQKVNHENE